MGKSHNHSGCDFQGRERFNDAAFGDSAVSALTDEHVELPPERDKVRDLALDLAQVLAGDGVHRVAERSDRRRARGVRGPARSRNRDRAPGG